MAGAFKSLDGCAGHHPDDHSLSAAMTMFAEGYGKIGWVRLSPGGIFHCADQMRCTKGTSGSAGSNVGLQ